jgi:hypothetical protein
MFNVHQLGSAIPNTLHGVPVFIVDPVSTEVTIRRFWKERLFTLPWHPFISHKVATRLVEVLENNQVVKFNHGLQMNAYTYSRCLDALNHDKNYEATIFDRRG